MLPPLYSAVADTFSGILQMHWLLHGTAPQVEERSFAYLSRWNFGLLSDPLKCDWRISFAYPNMGLGYDVVTQVREVRNVINILRESADYLRGISASLCRGNWGRNLKIPCDNMCRAMTSKPAVIRGVMPCIL